MSPYELEVALAVAKRCSQCLGDGGYIGGKCPQCSGSGYSLDAQYQQYVDDRTIAAAAGVVLEMLPFDEWCKKNNKTPFEQSLGTCLNAGCENEVYKAVNAIWEGQPALVRLCPSCANSLKGVDLK